MGNNRRNHLANGETFARLVDRIASSACGRVSKLRTPLRRKLPLYAVASLVDGVSEYLSMSSTSHARKWVRLWILLAAFTQFKTRQSERGAPDIINKCHQLMVTAREC